MVSDLSAEEAAEETSLVAGSVRQGQVAGRDYGTSAGISKKAGGKQLDGTDNYPPLTNEPSSNGGDGDFEDDNYDTLPWYRRPSVFWLLPAFTLFTMAFGAVVVPKLNVILDLICKEYLAEKRLSPADDTICQQIPEVQQLTARFVLYMQIISGFLSVITSPRLGSFSDRYGRRIVLAVSSSGLLLGEILVILAVKFPDIFSVNVLLLGNFFDGLCGSFLLGASIAHAYAADCTSIADRAVNFGYFHGAAFLGIALGPFLGGYVIQTTGNVLLVFYIGMAAHVAFILYVIFILPESLSKKKMEKAREKHARAEIIRMEELDRVHQPILRKARSWNPFGPLSIFWPTGPGSSSRVRVNLAILLAIDSLFYGIAIAGVTITIMYAEYKFKWHNYESSVFLSIVNSTRTALLFVVIPLMLYLIRRYTGAVQTPSSSTSADSQPNQPKHFGATAFEINLICFSLLAEMVGYLGYTLSNSPIAFTLSGVLTALAGAATPTIQSSMSKHVPSDKIGQLLGATTLMHSIMRIITPIVVNWIYSATIKVFPQATFVFIGSSFFLAAFLTLLLTPHISLHEDEHGNIVDSHVDAQVQEEEAESLLTN